ncbi:GRAM domain-containing protein [Algoriphagus yeomjeoni]|uniref:GRAM domain-containing protein n=1 Tax=Algoriphagus yeomjeoni TaxID=291403 RepID=A0A327P6M8_9BACT|nr:GRAM domain-containing protein [Algoriphagus yeomjeoni]RAI87909.1 GRAM domain-containing protein [Algoriphagus yeomjeoni]
MVTKINQGSWRKRLALFASNACIFILLLFLTHYFMDGEPIPWGSLIFQGVFFGLFMTIGFPYIFKKLGNNLGKSIHPELSPDEEIEMEGPANLFKGAEAVGGKLFLTNQKLIFKSHSLNIQTGQTDISYETIFEATPRKAAKFVDNGMCLTLIDGQEYHFVVSDRTSWMEKIGTKLKAD